MRSRLSEVAPGEPARARALSVSLRAWLPVLLYTLLIFAVSSRPYTVYFSDLEAPSYRLFNRVLQYPAHAAEYGLLAVLWLRALGYRRRPLPAAAGVAVAAVVATALVDETIQHFVPTRSFALRDLAMDAAGGILVAALWRVRQPIPPPCVSHSPRPNTSAIV